MFAVGALILASLYRPVTPTLWLDDCSSLAGWTVTNTGGYASTGTAEVYTGDGAGDLSCFRLYAKSGEWGYMGGGTGYSPGGVTLKRMFAVDVPEVGGRVEYVLGAEFKIKLLGQFSGRDYYQARVFTYDSSGNVLASFPLEQYTYTHDVWHSIELSINPQRGIFYVDGKVVGNDTLTRQNINPVGFGVSIVSPAKSGTTEIYFDGLHLAESPWGELTIWDKIERLVGGLFQ